MCDPDHPCSGLLRRHDPTGIYGAPRQRQRRLHPVCERRWMANHGVILLRWIIRERFRIPGLVFRTIVRRRRETADRMLQGPMQRFMLVILMPLDKQH